MYANFIEEYSFFIFNQSYAFDMFYFSRTTHSSLLFFCLLYGKSALSDTVIHELLDFYLIFRLISKCFKGNNNKFYYYFINKVAKQQKLLYYLKLLEN